MVLDYVYKNKNITQRVISKHLGVAVSMINKYLDDYEGKGYLIKNYISSKQIFYSLTKRGVERKNLLNIQYLNASQHVHHSAKENIVLFLNQIINKGFKRILMYGAGEVAEIMLQVIKNDKTIPLRVTAVVDDDKTKLSKSIVNTPIIMSDEIYDTVHEGILISSYTHSKVIYDKLIKLGYDNKKILRFFDN